MTVALCFQNHGWCPAAHLCEYSHDVDKVLDNETQPHQKRRRKRKKQKKTDQEGGEEGSQPEKRGKLDEDSLDSIESQEMECTNKKEHSENTALRSIFESQNDELVDSETSNQEETPSSNGTTTGIGHSSRKSELKSPGDSAAPIEDTKSEVTREVHASRTEGHRAGFDSFMTGFIFTQFIAKHGRFRGLPESPNLSDLGMQDFNNKVTLSGKDIPLQIMKSIFAKTSKDHQEKIEKIKLLYHSPE